MKHYIEIKNRQNECQLRQSKEKQLELIFQKCSLKINYKKITIFLFIKKIIIIFYFFLLCLPNKGLNLKSSNHVFYNDIDCIIVKNMLKKRIHPFNFVNEFHFFIDLISCKIPFSFIRFGDGENLIMRGVKINETLDKWQWNPKNKKFQESLIESSNICLNHNNFIGIPCKEWIKDSKSILSFSKCTSAKYMSYATLFINKNYSLFKDWIIHFINTSFPNRWKIILVANSIIHKSIDWAYKFYSVPDNLVDNWDNYGISLLNKLSHQANQNNLIFFISAGPAANIIISHLIKINNNNIYIDFGSAIEFITKGYSTRGYAKNNSLYSNLVCQPFFLQNKSLIYI